VRPIAVAPFDKGLGTGSPHPLFGEKQLKILHVAASMDPSYGGPPQGIRASIGATAAVGVQNEVVCCNAPDGEWMGRDAFPLHALGPGRFGFSYTPRLGPWLKNHAERFGVVVVHGMWQWPGICAFRTLAGHRNALTGGRKFGPGQVSRSGTRQPRLFLMPHGMLDPWFQRDPSRRVKAVRNWFYWWLVERRVVNGSQALLFTCEEELRLARTTFGGYRPLREVNVGLGAAGPPEFLPQMRGAFLAKLPRLGSRPYLLFLGRIHPKKGVDLLVRAYSGLLKTEKLKSGFPDLVVAGPGWESEYGRKVCGLIRGEGRIHAVGMLEGDAKWGAIYGCEAFVLPSHQENFGIAVVEALGCGRPVLISDKVNIWREIDQDGAGLVEDDSFGGAMRLLLRFSRGALAGVDPGRFRDCYRRRFGIQQAAIKFLDALKEE
jgi:glycosyltransferase involved in cell wall biosynthesis